MATIPETPRPCQSGAGCKGLEVYRPADVKEEDLPLADINQDEDVAFICCLDRGLTPDGGMLGIPEEWARYLDDVRQELEEAARPPLFPKGAPKRSRPSGLAGRSTSQ
jgi:hypothetical protein